MKFFIFSFFLLGSAGLLAQNKKPLDHSVYDGWQSIGEKVISNNGYYLAYTVVPQEGDGTLFIKKTNGESVAEISRGYSATITEDGRFVVYKIKPWYKDIREAKIKNKKADEIPKDSLGIFSLEAGKPYQLFARVKSYKLPEDTSGWVVLLHDKAESKKLKDSTVKKETADSHLFFYDEFADEDLPGDKKEEGAELVVINLSTGQQKTITNVLEYVINKKANTLLLEVAPAKKDSTQGMVLWYDVLNNKEKTIFKRFNDAKGFAMDDAGTQAAFFVERDSTSKALQKFYKLWYYKAGMDSSEMIADRFTNGILPGWTVSENSNIFFSKSADKLLFGTAPILVPKDTTVPEFERVNVDIWNYKDDYLQPQQLKNRDTEEKRSYTAIYDWPNKSVVQLGNKYNNPIYVTGEGDGAYFYSTSDSGMRIASQWQGFSLKNVYVVNPKTGVSTLVKANLKGGVYPSPGGKFLLMYDEVKKQYSVYNSATKAVVAVAASIPYPLYDVENDVPDDPNAYGIYKWFENDEAVLLYDQYDIWKVDPQNRKEPVCLTKGVGRKQKIEYRVINTDSDEKFIKADHVLWLTAFNHITKASGIARLALSVDAPPVDLVSGNVLIRNIIKSKFNDVLVFSQESYSQSPDLYSTAYMQPVITAKQTYLPGDFKQLTNLNPQQAKYVWGTAELFKWTAYTGKLTEGILYKPENFDASKKYPMLVYFYERNNETLHNYLAPSPTPSRLNIPFFVSRGYVVFVPDIWYKTGYPGKSAYDYIVSGTRAVVKKGFVDSTKIGLQGQSWGGYQIAHLITRTNLYAAAWAGAPVANMTSAYGGIRCGTGLNRQFQYEKTQSRIGATLWERPDLYIENSPLFHLPKVKTPLVIMANDGDDAVPWYQGIELFTALRRLGKPVWMLNYNGEAHNLVERKNRKDISIREQQFFDWMLKGEKPARWLSGGVPAVLKGREMGLGAEE